MTCKLCTQKEADKKNTHYLTDSIIRLCLNEDGSNIREKGFMFDVSNSSPFVEFSFQRETSHNSIIEALGREATDEEIESAKQNAFSVDYVFCSACEKLFTNIENNFTDNILPKLRGNDLTGKTEVSFDEKIIIRKFFLLQVWRTSVCDPSFYIPPKLQEQLRKIIFNEDNTDINILQIPLNITYLNTLGDDFEYTKNLVGLGSIEGNSVIFFNDFIIQAFEDKDSAKYIDIYGINSKDDFDYFTNSNEDRFLIKIIDNEKRIEVTKTYFEQERIGKILDFYKYIFQQQCISAFGQLPLERLTNTFIHGIIYGLDCTDENRYTLERFVNYADNFFSKLYNYR